MLLSVVRNFRSRKAGDWCSGYCSNGIMLRLVVRGVVGDGLVSRNIKIRWKSTAYVKIDQYISSK